MSHHGHSDKPKTLAGRVKEATGESVANCYQCGKCSAGCPIADEMDCAPSKVLRKLQLELPEMEDEILKSLSIWLCLSCQTCISRCPQEVDLPKIMDYLREESLKKGKAHPKSKDILAFHRSFLDMIHKLGKTYEIGLIAEYKLRTMHLLQDLGVAPKMFFKGKLNPKPHMIKDLEAVNRIFKETSIKRDDEK